MALVFLYQPQNPRSESCPMALVEGGGRRDLFANRTPVDVPRRVNESHGTSAYGLRARSLARASTVAALPMRVFVYPDRISNARLARREAPRTHARTHLLLARWYWWYTSTTKAQTSLARASAPVAPGVSGSTPPLTIALSPALQPVG